MKKHYTLPIIILLICGLILSIILGITFGPVTVDHQDVAKILYYKIFNVDTVESAKMLAQPKTEIIWNIRFPRVLMGMLVGAGLSLSGVIIQAVVKNPLANPYILGVSSGASLGATMAILLGAFSMFNQFGTAFGAFIGAVVTSLCVFSIAFSGQGRGNTIKLLLAGMAINAMCSAFTSFIIMLADDAEGIRSVTFWSMGGLTASSWKMIPIPTVTIILAIIFFLTQFRILNVLLVGEESAMTLGVNVVAMRKLYLVITSLVTGVAVAVSGTIGFVGLIIPHVVRMVVGSDHRKVVPISILLGSIFLIWCDVGARMLLENVEVPIGVITGMIGGPFFIYMMLTKSYGFGGGE